MRNMLFTIHIVIKLYILEFSSKGSFRETVSRGMYVSSDLFRSQSLQILQLSLIFLLSECTYILLTHGRHSNLVDIIFFVVMCGMEIVL